MLRSAATTSARVFKCASTTSSKGLPALSAPKAIFILVLPVRAGYACAPTIAAMRAGIPRGCLHAADALDSMPLLGETVEPDPDLNAVYEKLFPVYADIRNRMAPAWPWPRP